MRGVDHHDAEREKERKTKQQQQQRYSCAGLEPAFPCQPASQPKQLQPRIFRPGEAASEEQGQEQIERLPCGAHFRTSVTY